MTEFWLTNAMLILPEQVVRGNVLVRDGRIADIQPGGTQAAFGTPTATQSTATAINSVDDVGFKVQSVTTTGNFVIGNLLIAPDWADVTPMAVPEPATCPLLGLGGLIVAWKLRR